MRRLALLGAAEALPASLPLARAEIAHLALARQSLVSCRQIWSSVPAQPSPYLAALPWPGPAAPPLLLLIHHIPPYLVLPHTFSRIQLICRWTAQFMQWRDLSGSAKPTADPLLVSPEALLRAAAAAAAIQREHHLPSTRLHFRLAPGFTPEQADRLTHLVAPQLRATDLAAAHPDGTLEVLLTFDGPPAALRFHQRILELAAADSLLRGALAPTDQLPARAAA